MTTLHPVRPAPPGAGPASRSDATGSRGVRRSGANWAADGLRAGTELLASVLEGTAEDEQPVTHVHHLPIRQSDERPWPA